MSLRLVISCEHATNHVPSDLRRHFRRHRRLLNGHRAYDRGALSLARALARRLGIPIISGRVTRLVVDLNRSLQHPDVFSKVTRGLDAPTRERILERWYHPYREQVQKRIHGLVDRGHCVLHLSVHSFVPVLAGEVRRADLGLLYDPARRPEKEFCLRWADALRDQLPQRRVRRNYPYRGVADGLTTFLRRHYGVRSYLGVELELNQHWTRRPKEWKRLELGVLASLRSLLGKES